MTGSQGHSRFEHCLLAGLLGDAWGGAYEGQANPIEPAFPKIAAISDDTQLVLATCEAIIEGNGTVDPATVAERFRVWFTAGRLTGLGSSTLKAVRDLAAGAHWALSGARGEFAAGAGAAMRAAPLAFFVDPRADADRQTIRDVARITHHSDEAYVGSLAVIVAVRHCAAAGMVPSALPSIVAAELPDTAVRDRILEIASDTPEHAASRFGATGHVVDAVPLALLLASCHVTSCDDVIRAAISLGGDTDTIAALAAQVLGASGIEPSAALLARIPDTADALPIFSRTARLAARGD